MRLVLLLTSSLLLSLGCNIINPAEEEPSFVGFDQIVFVTNNTQGSASHKFTEAWLHVNDNMIGAYDPPAMVPVLDKGNVKVTCYAGIRNNGISTTRIRYPFIARYDTIVSLKAFEQNKIVPRFRYQDNVVIDYSRNFESGNSFASYGNNQGSFSLVTDASLVFEGTRSGLATLPSGASYFHFKDNNLIQLESGNTHFLEMNYSCNNSFIVGVYTTTGSTTKKNPIITLTPTTVNADTPVWNKIYIDLGVVMMNNPSASFHELFIEGSVYESGSPKIYLDNLKFVKWQ